MAVTLNRTRVYSGGVTAVAPTILSAETPATLSDSGFSGDSSGPTPIGCRVPFSPAKDLSSRKYVGFDFYLTIYGLPYDMDTVANGGFRMFFYDGSGNYAGFNIYGNDVPDYTGEKTADGFFVSYPVQTTDWCIDTAKTPDYASGTIDWSDIAGVEFHLKMTYARSVAMQINDLWTISDAVITGGSVGSPNKFQSLGDSVLSSGSRVRDFTRVPYHFFGGSGVGYSSHIGFTIGDGSTETVFTDRLFALGFWNTWESGPEFRSIGPIVQLDESAPDRGRVLKINQSATDEVSMSDGSIASGGGWGLVVEGAASGLASFARVSFVRANVMALAHAEAVDCVWDSCDVIDITADTVVTGAIIRNVPTGKPGLRLTAAPGDYSGLMAKFSSNARDITINPSSAGTFVLTGVTVEGTLKIHNASSTLAIVVELASGISYTATTEGGSITVAVPQTSLTLTNLVSGSRLLIRNTDTQDVLVNETTGTSYVYEYEYSADVPIEIIVRKATGSPAYQEWRTTTTLTATNASLTAGQVLDE